MLTIFILDCERTRLNPLLFRKLESWIMLYIFSSVWKMLFKQKMQLWTFQLCPQKKQEIVDYRHFPGSQFKLAWVIYSSINVTQVADTVLHLQQSKYLFVLIYSFRVELIKFDFINSTWPTPNGKFENFYKLNIFWMQFEWRIIKYIYNDSRHKGWVSNLS